MARLLNAGLLAGALALAGCGDDEPPASGARSVDELFAVIDHGPLLKRRAAVRELSWAAIAGPRELERVLPAARQRRRRVLRDSARAAIRSAALRPELAPLLCQRLRETGNEDLRDISIQACWASRPAAPREPLAETVPAAQWQEICGQSMEPRVRRLVEDAVAAGPDSDKAKQLLADPGFLARGLAAGKELARLGAGILPAAVELAASGDPRSVDAGIGAILYMADPKARPALEKLRRHPSALVAAAAGTPPEPWKAVEEKKKP
ncbi:MAG: hypothetical protein HY927_05030 [Elusimicrobia bacterium]|nr:hypothetical protein [Elusimicrobiota bacterium]